MSVEFGDARIPERIWEAISVNPKTGCWEWTLSTRGKGYGQVSLVPGKQEYFHIVMYRELVGPILRKMDLDHRCRVHLCGNPKCLEPVTRKVNLSRGKNLAWMVSAAMTHCKRGHEFTKENTLPAGVNGRRCRICTNNNRRASRARKRENNAR